MDQQLNMFFPQREDTRAPETITWNPWHGCTKVSTGCLYCYMYRLDESVGRDPTVVQQTQSFNLPVRRLRSGQHKGLYKIPSGSHIFTCFSSDFFHSAADTWRPMAWKMIRDRSDCTFFMIAKRPERIADHLPPDWGDGWPHVTIAVTCENQQMADSRLPIFMVLPLRHKSIMIEPMLTTVDLTHFFSTYPGQIEAVSVGGESGPEARPCDYAWVLSVHKQCIENGASFSYHQTGARLIKDGKEYLIPREYQHSQARKAKLDYNGMMIPEDEDVL